MKTSELTGMFRYRAFGLVLASEDRLPSLAPTELSSDAYDATDVIIRRGSIQAVTPLVQVGDLVIGRAADRVYVQIDEVGRFLVSKNNVIFDPERRATSSEVQIYLLGSVIGCLLYLRGRLPLHCNALQVGSKAVLFCGTSGAGKSTLAAFMETRGYAVLTDDLCAIDMGGPVPVAAPGIPRLKLWDDALAALGKQAEASSPLPWHMHKRELPVGRGAHGEFELSAIYHLQDRSGALEFGIDRLTGLDAINSLTANIYRRRVGDLLGCGQNYLDAAVELVRTTPVFSLVREWSITRFQENALKIERHMLESMGR